MGQETPERFKQTRDTETSPASAQNRLGRHPRISPGVHTPTSPRTPRSVDPAGIFLRQV